MRISVVKQTVKHITLCDESRAIPPSVKCHEPLTMVGMTGVVVRMLGMERNELLDLLRYFHGHLGPNLIAGYRMGLIARSDDPRKVTAKVHCGTEPPDSCLIDGIQLTSCCTMGKGNIEVVGEGQFKAEFLYPDGRSVTIRVRDEALRRMREGLDHDNEEQRSIDVLEMPEDELFEITRSD